MKSLAAPLLFFVTSSFGQSSEEWTIRVERCLQTCSLTYSSFEQLKADCLDQLEKPCRVVIESATVLLRNDDTLICDDFHSRASTKLPAVLSNLSTFRIEEFSPNLNYVTDDPVQLELCRNNSTQPRAVWADVDHSTHSCHTSPLVQALLGQNETILDDNQLIFRIDDNPTPTLTALDKALIFVAGGDNPICDITQIMEEEDSLLTSEAAEEKVQAKEENRQHSTSSGNAEVSKIGEAKIVRADSVTANRMHMHFSEKRDESDTSTVGHVVAGEPRRSLEGTGGYVRFSGTIKNHLIAGEYVEVHVSGCDGVCDDAYETVEAAVDCLREVNGRNLDQGGSRCSAYAVGTTRTTDDTYVCENRKSVAFIPNPGFDSWLSTLIINEIDTGVRYIDDAQAIACASDTATALKFASMSTNGYLENNRCDNFRYDQIIEGHFSNVPQEGTDASIIRFNQPYDHLESISATKPAFALFSGTYGNTCQLEVAEQNQNKILFEGFVNFQLFASSKPQLLLFSLALVLSVVFAV